MILAYFLAISGLKIWWGGDAFTVRHLIPILPFFGISMNFLPRKYYLPFVGFGLVSFFQMLVASATIYNPFDQIIKKILNQGFVFSWKTSLIYQKMLPRLLQNRLTFSWGQHSFGIEPWYFNLAIPVLAAIVFLIVFYFINRRNDQDSTHADSSQIAKSPNVE